MNAIQYDLFQENTEICLIRQETEAIKKEVGNFRRGFFSRYDELKKEIFSLKKEIHELRGLCLENRNQ